MQIDHDDTNYCYILLLMNVFSQFFQNNKKGSIIKKKLHCTYSVHGKLEPLQNVNGGELKKNFEKNRVKSKKIMRSHPYSLKAHENVDRLHQELLLKIYYDLMNQKNIEVNWFNVDKREILD